VISYERRGQNLNYKKVKVALFFAILVFVAMATFLLPKKTFSETENRMLATAPKINLEDIKDKSFMEKAESFMTDHIVFRNQLSSGKTKLELLQGKKEVNKVFICDNMLLENIKDPNNKITNNNIDAMNKFAAKYSGKIQTDIMIVPTAIEFYKPNISQFADTFDQAEYIQQYYARLKNINCIDSYAPLSAAAENNIFYKTDHHWTSYGSYIGYTSMAKSLGFKPVSYDMFNIEYASNDFLGTLYSKVVYGESLADKVDLYHYSKGDVVTDVVKYTGRSTQTFSSIFFKENLETKDKYSVFLGSNEALVRVKTNVKNGKKLIMFKDSYSHSLMQFLPLHYEEIALVDMRYLNKPLSEYINIEEYKQAIFIYNMGGFASDSSIKKVAQY